MRKNTYKPFVDCGLRSIIGSVMMDLSLFCIMFTSFESIAKKRSDVLIDQAYFTLRFQNL